MHVGEQLAHINRQKMGKFLLTFVRHGETEYNKKRLLQGQIDIPLNEQGIKQADALGRYLSNERFDRIYSSDLSRCVQTAEGLIKNAAVPRPNIITDARLRERHFGEDEGMPRDARTSRGKKEPNGAETRSQVIDRGLSFFEELCLAVHKEFGHRMDDSSKDMEGSSADGQDEEVEEGDSFEVVFADDGSPGVGACTDGVTPNSVNGTVVSQKEDDDGEREVKRTKYDTSTTDRTSEASQDLQLQRKVSDSNRILSDNSIFKSDATWMNQAPPNCPHIFVSSHGYMLRALFQSLLKRYKMILPGSKKVLWTRCPNTGLSTFLLTLDSDGFPRHIENYFLHTVMHLEGIEFISVNGK
nr:fructose-2,6-bisphosphatase TIGAR-like [Lytechinus pictus]